jgi:uncharacterized membrane protein (DUF373 family)
MTIEIRKFHFWAVIALAALLPILLAAAFWFMHQPAPQNSLQISPPAADKQN